MKPVNWTAIALSILMLLPLHAGASETIYACAKPVTGALRVVEAPGQCRRREYEVSWSTGTESEQQINELLGRVAAIEAALGVINAAPEVSAGDDQTILLSMIVTPGATVTDDGLVEPLRFAWDEPAATGNVNFLSPNELETDVTFEGPGVYALRLSVSDGAVTVSDELQVTVYPDNTPPSIALEQDIVVVPAAYVQLPNYRWGVACRDIDLGAVVTDDGLPLPAVYDWSLTFLRPRGGISTWYQPGWSFSSSESETVEWPVNLGADGNRLAGSPQAANLPNAIDAGFNLTVSDGYHETDAYVDVSCDVRVSEVPTADAGAPQVQTGANTDPYGSYQCMFDLAGVADDDDLPLPLSTAWSSSFPPYSGTWQYSYGFSDPSSLNTTYRMQVRALYNNSAPSSVTVSVFLNARDGHSSSLSQTEMTCQQP